MGLLGSLSFGPQHGTKVSMGGGVEDVIITAQGFQGTVVYVVIFNNGRMGSKVWMLPSLD